MPGDVLEFVNEGEVPIVLKNVITIAHTEFTMEGGGVKSQGTNAE